MEFLMVEVQTIPMGPFQVNCHILIDRGANEFVVIDAPMMTPVFDELMNSGLRAKIILLTHAHIDHIAALNPLKQKLNCPVALHEKDRFLLDHVSGNPFQEMLQASVPPHPDQWLTEDFQPLLGTDSIQVIHTPGHTPGSVSFYIPDTGVFTGDALFLESVGRTDLPGGDTEVLMASIQNKLFALADNTQVFPGHGPKTTIGHERKFNPFVRHP